MIFKFVVVTTVVDAMIISVADVPTVKSATTVVPSDLYPRAHAAVPLATGVTVVAENEAEAFMFPDTSEGAPNAVLANVNVASAVLPERAVSGFAGFVPLYITSVPPFSSAASAETEADAAAWEIFIELPF